MCRWPLCSRPLRLIPGMAAIRAPLFPPPLFCAGFISLIKGIPGRGKKSS